MSLICLLLAAKVDW